MSVKKKTKELAAAEAAGKWELVGDLLSEVGKLLVEQGQLREALDYHRREQQVCETRGDSKGLALAHRSLGEVLQELQEFQESIGHKETYLEMAIQLQDAAEEQRALYVLGQTYLAMADTLDREVNAVRALDYFGKSLKAVEAIPLCEVEKGEKSIMRARCIRNLATVNWSLGKRENFFHFFTKAKDILESADSRQKFEDLHGLYDEASNLLLAGSEEDFKLSVKYSKESLGKALHVHGKRLRACHFGALVTRSKVQIVQEDYEEAFKTLFTAFKLGVTSSLGPHVENNLKMLAVVVRARESIARQEVNLSGHFESMADALCKYSGGAERVKVLLSAVRKYEKASQSATEDGSVEALPALNNSIAQTYMDVEDFPQAETYFLKQLEYECGLPESACQTYSNLASVRESQGQSWDAVLGTMQSWLSLAESSGLVGQERIALQELVGLHRRLGREEQGGGYRERLEALGDSEELPSSQGSSVGRLDNFPEVELEALSMSEAVSGSTERPRRLNSKLVTKVNAHGESALHVAAKSRQKTGELVRLLDRGHPTEVTENAGWTPLGDAVGEENLEAVKILLEYGANVNHVNDKGETPFMAACAYRWLEGASCLLEKGAKVHLKDRRGSSGLTHLRQWQAEVQDVGLNVLVSKVEAAYSKLGLEAGSVPVHQEEEEEDSPCQQELLPMPSPPRMRRRQASPSRSPRSLPRSPPTTRTPSLGQGTKQYYEAIQALRGSSRHPLQPLTRETGVSSRSSSGGSSPGEDWLEDDMADMPTVRKKRKGSDEFPTSKRSSRENKSPARMKTIDLTSSSPNKASVAAPREKKMAVKTTSVPKKASSVFQPKISQMYSRTVSRSPSPILPAAPPAPALSRSETVARVRVRVEGQLLLLPLASRDLTISWLAREAAARYFRVQGGAEPVLRLTTSDGALLDGGDLVREVMDAEDRLLEAEVTGWISKTALEKYTNFCADRNVTSFQNILQKLTAVESSHVFAFSAPLRTQTDAVLSSLTDCSSLRHLSLTSCQLTDSCLPLLAACLSSLPSLASLDLSSNRLTAAVLRSLASLAPLPYLASLRLGRNMVGDSSLPDLSTALPALTSLHLSSCYLATFSSRHFSQLHSLDISLNRLGRAGLRSFLCGPATALGHLNLSGCLQPGSVPLLSPQDSPLPLSSLAPGLHHLDISNLGLTDSVLAQLCPSLCQCRHLATLDISHNPVTARGLVTLLVGLSEETVPLAKLRLRQLKSPDDGFWSHGSEELCATLVALLVPGAGVRLEEVALPPGAGARQVAEVWAGAWGELAAQAADSSGSLVLSTKL